MSRPFQFGLATLLLAMSLIALFFGLLQIAPSAAIAFLFVAPPTIRTLVEARRARNQGTTFDYLEWLDCFTGSLGVIWGTIFLGLMAFASGSLAGFPIGLFLGLVFGSQNIGWPGTISALLVGSICGLLAVIFFVRTLWDWR